MADDITQRIIFDDSDLVKGLENMNKKVDESINKMSAFQKEASTASKQIGEQLANNSQKAAKELDNLTNSAVKNLKVEEERKKTISEIAVEIAKSGKASQQLSMMYKALGNATDTALKSKDVQIALSDIGKEAGLSADKIKILQEESREVGKQLKYIDSKEFKEIANEAEKATTKFKTAKSELRELKDLILSGQLTGVELEQAKNRAADLTDQIADLNTEINSLSSDTRRIEVVIQGFQAMAAGIGIAQGAMVLFGDENENFKETLIKLNAIMVISQSLQQAHQLLYEETALAIKIAAVQQKLYNVVVGQSTGVLKGFRIALAATGVGLIVLAIGALVANWDKLTESVKNSTGWLGKVVGFFKSIDSTAKGLVRSVTSVFENLGSVIKSVLTGQFGEAISEFKNLGRNAAEAFKEGFNENEFAKLKNSIAASYEGAAKALKRHAEEIEAAGKNTYKTLKLAMETELKALILRNADEEEILDKRHEIRLLDLKRQKEINDRQAQLDKEAAGKLAAAKAEYEKIIKELQDGEHTAGVFDEAQYNAIIRDRTVQIYKAQKKAIQEIGDTLKIDVSEYLERFDKIIEVLMSEQFIKPINKLPAIFEKEHKPVFKKLEYTFKKSFDELLDDLKNSIDDDGGAFNYLIKKLTGADDDIIKGVNTFVSEFGNLINESTQIQLSAIDEQLKKLTDRRTELEESLKREQELYDMGLANNLENKKAEVDGLLSEEQRLNDEREKLQQEAERRQLRAETVQQTQSLITSSIDIIKGFAKIPLVGLPLGIAAVGSLFAFFAKTKADAFKATRLYTGAERISDHFGETGTKSDIPGRGNGYRLIDTDTGADTGVIISGREQLIPELTSRSQAKFFKNLKKGMYNFDIAEALAVNTNKKTTTSGNTIINQNVESLDRQWITYTDKRGNTKARLMKIPSGDEVGSVVIIKD